MKTNKIILDMISKFIKYSLSILFLLQIAGCDDYAEKPIEEYIYVNQSSMSLFVGETIQLEASPTDGTHQFSWTSEDPSVATVTSNGLVEVVGEGFTNIIVKSNNLSTKVELNAIVRIPLEEVLISETSMELYVGNRKTVFITLLPENANDVPAYSWGTEDPLIATVSEGGEITAVGEGITYIVYKIGDFEKRIEVDAATTRPFMGPHILSAEAPYELMSAKFDLGGQGNAFHDNDGHDASGQNGNYRVSNGDNSSTAVDIEGYGLNVGWTNPGEWLLYTVEVVDAGEYKVDVQAASPSASSFHLELNGENVTGTINTPNTGGWGAYQWVTTPEDKLTLNLTKGKHKITYYFEGGHNFRSLRFTKK